jgi:hypothetical protein
MFTTKKGRANTLPFDLKKVACPLFANDPALTLTPLGNSHAQFLELGFKKEPSS